MTTITFEDVESARSAYQAKLSAAHKTRITAFFIILAIFLVVGLAIFFANPNLRSLINFQNGFPIHVMMPMIFTIGFPVIFALVISTLIAHLKHPSTKEQQAYRHVYKAYFVSQQLQNVFSSLRYDHSAGLDSSALSSTGLFYTGDIYRSNDLVVAKYKDVDFTQADVDIKKKVKERDKDGNIEERIVPVFKGRFFIFVFPKQFNSELIVTAPSQLKIIHPGNTNQLETESIDFNRRFITYAGNGPEAFYILTPDIMANLETLADQYPDQLSLVFTGNKLYLAIDDNGDAFEPPADSSVPLDEKHELSRVIADIQPIINLVDQLKLFRTRSQTP